MFTPEQFIASQKANFEVANSLAIKAFDGVEKLVKLNLSTAKNALVESHDNVQAMLSVKDIQELVALQSEMVQPMVQKVAQYGHEVYEIVAEAGGKLGKAVEAKAAENREQFSDLFENAVKNAPAGSEAATAMVKNAVAAANNAFDTMQKVVKQASDIAESNFNAAAASATKVAKATTARKK